MKKVLVVYWSSSGNTEAMAQSVVKGVTEGGAEAGLKTPDAASADLVKSADALAFGSPAMGDEVIEEDDMEPFIADLGAKVEGEGLIAHLEPGEGELAKCYELGKKLAG